MACEQSPTKTVIDCGGHFFITKSQVDVMENTGKLRNVSEQIKTLKEARTKCLKAKK